MQKTTIYTIVAFIVFGALCGGAVYLCASKSMATDRKLLSGATANY